MSSKFLPFITNNSKPDILFSALLKRSKDISFTEMVTIFSTITCIGIEEIREKLEKLPENDNPATYAFSYILSSYHQFKIPIKELYFWDCYLHLYDVSDLKIKKENYTASEVSLMLACLANFAPNKLEDIGFLGLDPSTLVEFSRTSFDIPLKKLKNLKIKENGTKLAFSSLEEFKAYVADKELSENKENINPIFIENLKTDLKLPCPFFQLKSHFSAYKKRDGDSNEIPF